MKNYTHLCLYERQRIERYLRDKKSLQFIADKLDRSISSISEEIRQNSVDGVYNARKADHKAYVKRKYSKVQCLKVATDSKLREFVEKNIAQDQSPEGISGRLKNVEKSIRYASFKAIYKFIKSPYGRNIEKHLYSKAVKRKGGPKRGRTVSIDGRIMIDKRPKSVSERLEFGHYEADFIESGKDGKGSLLVMVERKTRYPFLEYMEKRDTESVNMTVDKILAGLPVKSITIDNDISFQKHEELSELIDATVFFCHPQCPHEKGTIENRNKAIRRYIKKKSDLSKYPKEFFSEVERNLRDRFMKCLDYKTPIEVFNEEVGKASQTTKKPLLCGMIKEELYVN